MGKSSVTNWICLKFEGCNFKKWFTFVKTLPSFNESGLRKKKSDREKRMRILTAKRRGKPIKEKALKMKQTKGKEVFEGARRDDVTIFKAAEGHRASKLT
jgi:hypothetical protein